MYTQKINMIELIIKVNKSNMLKNIFAANKVNTQKLCRFFFLREIQYVGDNHNHFIFYIRDQYNMFVEEKVYTLIMFIIKQAYLF